MNICSFCKRSSQNCPSFGERSCSENSSSFFKGSCSQNFPSFAKRVVRIHVPFLREFVDMLERLFTWFGVSVEEWTSFPILPLDCNSAWGSNPV